MAKLVAVIVVDPLEQRNPADKVVYTLTEVWVDDAGDSNAATSFHSVKLNRQTGEIGWTGGTGMGLMTARAFLKALQMAITDASRGDASDD